MLTAAACATTAIVMTTVAPAAAAPAELEPVELPAKRFQKVVETHAALTRYEDVLERAKRLEVAPKDDLLDQRRLDRREVESGIEDLEQRIEQAEPKLAPGVSLATLEAIAACESGGDPTAVNAAGYYGKYQFDMGTWASVGGSGNPAQAPEAEQDYRASLLYSRAGSSPWPVCGV
jgi:soluble lytic murein transglycosylase-like protein